MPDTEVLEVATHDAEQGVSFYTLEQTPSAKPQLTRQIGCLLCHLSWDTLAVPGLTTLSTFPMSDDPNAYASGVVVDGRTPIAERWGGWYVTGRLVPVHHMGNVPVIVPAAELARQPANPPKLESVGAKIAKADAYPSAQSDVAALMDAYAAAVGQPALVTSTVPRARRTMPSAISWITFCSSTKRRSCRRSPAHQDLPRRSRHAGHATRTVGR